MELYGKSIQSELQTLLEIFKTAAIDLHCNFEHDLDLLSEEDQKDLKVVMHTTKINQRAIERCLRCCEDYPNFLEQETKTISKLIDRSRVFARSLIANGVGILH